MRYYKLSIIRGLPQLAQSCVRLCLEGKRGWVRLIVRFAMHQVYQTEWQSFVTPALLRPTS